MGTDDAFDANANRNNAIARLQAVRAASCVKICGQGVVRVVRRVDDAKENNNLGEQERGMAGVVTFKITRQSAKSR